MGLNIGVRAGCDWDSGRFAGDDDFAYDDNAFKRVYAPIEFRGYADSLWRPASIDAARKWVEESPAVPAGGNKERLLKLLDVLERNPDIWLENT